MRTDIPLREISLEELWAEVQRLRNELLTHNHLDIGNAQLLTGEVRGILQSPNFVSGSFGWQIKPDGNVEFNSGTFRGDLAVGSGDSICKIDSNGLYLGNAVFADAPFSVTPTGLVTATSFKLLQKYTTGESIDAGKLVALKNTVETWGNDVNADHYVLNIIAADSYIDQEPANAATNYGSAVLLYAGATTYTQLAMYKINFLGALETWNEVDKVILRICLVFNDINVGKTINYKVYRITADWAEGTVTWDTQPAHEVIPWATLTLTDTSSTNTYYDLDITHLYRLWRRGAGDSGYDNYGFYLVPDAAEGTVRFGSKERDGGRDFDQEPYLVVTSNKDSDGKAYLASKDDYNLVKNILGIAQDTVSAGATVKVLSLIEGSYNLGSYTQGRNYYLTDNVGSIGTLATPLEFEKYNILVGMGRSDRLQIKKSTKPIFLSKFTYIFPEEMPEDIKSFDLVAPVQATMAIIDYYLARQSGAIPILNQIMYGQMILFRDRVCDLTEKEWITFDTDSLKFRGQWRTSAPGNGNILITMTKDGGGVENNEFRNCTATIYFYE